MFCSLRDTLGPLTLSWNLAKVTFSTSISLIFSILSLALLKEPWIITEALACGKCTKAVTKKSKIKSVTLFLAEQPHTPQFCAPALKQGHLCSKESRGQLPAFLHTLRLCRLRLCHLWTQQRGLNTGVRIERSVKMKIAVKTQTTGYGHSQEKRDLQKVKIFWRPSCFRTNLSQRRGTENCIRHSISERPGALARKEPSLLGQLYTDLKYPDHPHSTIPKTAQAGAGGYRTWESRGASQRTPTPRGNPAARTTPLLL